MLGYLNIKQTKQIYHRNQVITYYFQEKASKYSCNKSNVIKSRNFTIHQVHFYKKQNIQMQISGNP